MNNDLLIALVDEDFGIQQEGRNWYRAEKHSSLVVNSESGKWYWNAENMGGGVLDYLVLVRGLNIKSAKEIFEIRGRIVNGTQIKEDTGEASLPYNKLVDLFWSLGKGNREYWYNRCITDRTIDRYKLGFYDGWNTIPLYVSDDFVNFQCRRDEPFKYIKYWYKHQKPVLLNPDLLSLVDTVFMTEGAVDALLLNQEGIPAVATTGGAGYWNNVWFPYFVRVKMVYYIADHDEAGMIGAWKMANCLGVDRVKVYTFDKSKPEKYDTGDYFKDGGTANEFRMLVESDSRFLYEIGELNDRQAKGVYKISGRIHQKVKAGQNRTN